MIIAPVDNGRYMPPIVAMDLFSPRIIKLIKQFMLYRKMEHYLRNRFNFVLDEYASYPSAVLMELLTAILENTRDKLPIETLHALYCAAKMPERITYIAPEKALAHFMACVKLHYDKMPHLDGKDIEVFTGYVEFCMRHCLRGVVVKIPSMRCRTDYDDKDEIAQAIIDIYEAQDLDKIRLPRWR